MKPRISIVVPVYKIKEEYLRQCIESLLVQTFDNIEIHLVDDGSPDNCGNICDEYAARDNRIIAHHVKNRGVGAARNTGIDASCGEYLIFVDADDWIDKDYCKNISEIITQNDVDIVISGYSYKYKNRKIPVHMSNDEYSGKTQLSKNLAYELMSAALYLQPYIQDSIANSAELSVSIWAKAYKRDFLNINELRFTTGIHPLEDNIFWADTLLHMPQLYFDNKISYYYRICSTSVTQRPMASLSAVRNFEKTTQEFRRILMGSHEYEILLSFFVITELIKCQKIIVSDKGLCYTEKKKLIKSMVNQSDIHDCINAIKHNKWERKLTIHHRIIYVLVKHNRYLILIALHSLKTLLKNLMYSSEMDSYE